MKFLTQHEILYRDAQQKEQREYLAQPSSIEIQRKLNGISTCTLVYPSLIDNLALKGDEEESLYPFEMRLAARTAASTDKNSPREKHQLFCGYLNSLTIAPGGAGLILEYADPLMTLLEQDDPKIWNSTSRHTLQEIFDHLMSNSFDRASAKGGAKRLLKTHFVDKPPQAGSGLLNLGRTDLEFIQELSRMFGYHFHFQHHFDSASEYRVQFAKPDFSKQADSDINLEGSYQFRSGLGSFFDKVQVVHSSGEKISSIQDTIGNSVKSFQLKLKARDVAGFELVYHDHRPAFQADEAQAYGEGILISKALENGDELNFDSWSLLELGSLIDIRKNSDINPELPSRIVGKYLIAGATSVYRGRGWAHHYRAIRP